MKDKKTAVGNDEHISPEQLKELSAMIRRELEEEKQREKEARSIWKRICKDFEADFERCNYVKETPEIDCLGRPYVHTWEYKDAFKVRSAIATLVRAACQVKTTAKLPAEKEKEVREFVGAVLTLMRELKEGE